MGLWVGSWGHLWEESHTGGETGVGTMHTRNDCIMNFVNRGVSFKHRKTNAPLNS